MLADKLLILRGNPIKICDGVVVQQPTIGEIADAGGQDFFGAVWQLCSSAYDMPSMFDDMGLDFMEIDDWTYFRMVSRAYTPQQTSLILGDLDLSSFQEMQRNMENGETDIVLYNGEIIIDEPIYRALISVLREMVGFSHQGKKAGNSATKKLLIMDDRKRRKRQAKKDESDSMIFDMVISLVNTEEFFYDYETVYDLTFYQLLKSFVQIQGKKSAVALMQGSMSGFVDTKGIPAIDMAWTYSEEKYKPRAKSLVNNKITKGKK